MLIVLKIETLLLKKRNMKVTGLRISNCRLHSFLNLKVVTLSEHSLKKIRLPIQFNSELTELWKQRLTAIFHGLLVQCMSTLMLLTYRYEV